MNFKGLMLYLKYSTVLCVASGPLNMMYCEKVFKELHNYISATIDLESVLLTSIAIYSD